MKPTPKYIKQLVEGANKQLARDGSKALTNQLFQFIHSYLTAKDIEHRHGYFHYALGGKVEEDLVDVFNPVDKDSFIQIVL